MISSGIFYRWGFYAPDGPALDEVSKLVDEGKVLYCLITDYYMLAYLSFRATYADIMERWKSSHLHAKHSPQGVKFMRIMVYDVHPSSLNMSIPEIPYMSAFKAVPWLC